MPEKPVVIAIAVGGYGILFENCLQTHQDYCDRNGYRMLLVSSLPFEVPANDAAWLKVQLILAELEKGTEYVAFIDADCEIRESAAPFESLFENGNNLAMCKGKSGRYNSGVIFIRNDEQVRSFFRTLLANADRPVPAEDQAPYENGHFIHYLKLYESVQELPQTWNNNVQLDEDSHIQHFSGGKLRDYYLDSCVGLSQRLRLYFYRKIRRITGVPSKTYLNTPSTRERVYALAQTVR